jgi:DNA-binding winged helix-turn-helix (wHTH) protein/TolB-like protein
MASRRFRFGLFEFDGAAGELRREGAVVRLQGQPALALGCLVASAGQVVTREELCRAIWGSETHVDFERGLNFCIGQIRSALQDDADSSRYVRTIPRRGYQFIAPVEVMAQDSQRTEPAVRKVGLSVSAIAVVSALVLLVLGLSGGYWLRSRASANGAGERRAPIVAVLRFDNETPDPALTPFSDDLTDSVVAQLTTLSNGQYQVIGNAAILRLPREQRDLKAIGSSLHADYVVLGQVQGDGAQSRILAHLIRLPDQTHVWVVRMDHPVLNALRVVSTAADKIAGEFAPRLIQAAQGIALPSASPAATNR